MVTVMVSSQNQSAQLTGPMRGPGISDMPSSEVLPVQIAKRAISTCAKTLIVQPMRISQRKKNPASAPVAVVAISSPEPTTAPATIRPGPSSLRMPLKEVGAVRMPDGESDGETDGVEGLSDSSGTSRG